MPSKPTATRGRPKKTIEEIESIRKNLLMATSQIFGDCGSQGTTVAKIIQSANVSRPTFYKYFTNANEPLELVIEQANIRLVEKIKKKSKESQQTVLRLLAVIDCYLEWGKEEIEILPSIHQELLITSSFVSKHRIITLDQTYKILKKTLKEDGRSMPDRILFESAIMAIENIGYNLLLNTNGSKTDKYRGDMLKVAIALFGEREEWKNAVSNEFL